MCTKTFFVNFLQHTLIEIQGCPYSTDPSGNAITFDRDVRSLNDIPRLKRQSKQIFTMEQYTPHKSHNNRFSEEIVSGPFDVEKW